MIGDDMNSERGKLRMERLRQLELEQLQWEEDALIMPEHLDRALALSFQSVKTEFSDLDGLSWPRYPVPLVTNPWATDDPRTPTFPHPRPDVAQDTIRVSRPAQPRSPLQPTNRDPPPHGRASYPAHRALACHGLRPSC